MTENTRGVRRLRALADEGFGLIEIVVSMFMLALLAIAFAPLLIQSLQVSAENSTVATATQLVNDRMRIAQANGPTCSAVASLVGTTSVTDSRNVTITVTTTVGACPTGAGTVRVSAVAVRTDTDATVAQAATLVFVE